MRDVSRWHNMNELIFSTELAGPAAGGRWRTVLGTLAIVLPIPLLLASFLYEQFHSQRLLVGLTGVALGGGGLIRFSRTAGRRQRDLAAACLIAGGLTVCASLLWNYAYLDFCTSLRRGGKDVFRPNFRHHFAPFYGKQGVSTWRAALPAVVLAMGIWGGAWLWRPARRLRWWGLPLIMAAQLAMIAVLGVSDLEFVSGRQSLTGSAERISGRSVGFQPFREDAAQFKTVSQLYRQYVDRMPGLSWFGQHYPPGPATIFLLERRFHVAPLGGWVSSIFVVLATPFVYAAGAALSDRPIVANAATVAYATATGGLLYPLLSTTPLVLLPGAVAIWAFVRGLKAPAVTAAALGVLLGVMMIAFALASLAAAFFAGVLALVWLGCLLGNVVRRQNLFLLAAAAVAAAFGCHWLLKTQAHFDLLHCAAQAARLHHLQAASNGFDNFDRWFFRSSCNLLAFLLINLPLLALFVATLLLWRRTDRHDLGRMFCPAVTIMVFIAAGCGSFYAETERIWMLFLPAIALAAGTELAREDRGADVRRAVALMTLFVVLQELIFIHGTT